jgi:hypothetical protein
MYKDMPSSYIPIYFWDRLLDSSTFKTERAHRLALTTTLKTIKEKLGSRPTVLWTGNGYHMYQPVDAFVLEQEEIFSKFGQPSMKFLKFA